ncbi:DUF465 domain-containing protein [Caballeronia sp. LP006]|jgi:hypothetical protein|uniref:DUF465 domain-containing protein n=1 Tax=unclassified Caballeronia TaxID=2646786 RepID=UPI001FD10A6C|nr:MULTISPECIES: DUF465 domain-containing protein [unclassified Caballeronia]MDR5771713.1 DUF465 domain-containing protein [Caballeronia sp. LZ002]MDR5805049.1 DUF465 domain-containing protein [Caballeronia sp. LZ001]MDR5831371.1 DUF465 domain-containing protein [Caballeronia sp. LP006]MDR5847148.1 DUF465 domain-containing protein [Caballeronia sp. LZ003]
MQQRLNAPRQPAVDATVLRDRITQLQEEHHGLSTLIDKMGGIDDLELRRLKKRKLKVKDTILLLQLQLDGDAH